jgi:4-amino-4-deoxy-L-arabinose transferase-like glycosyltransferase
VTGTWRIQIPRRLLLPLIIVAAAVVYLVGNDRVALWDRDEPRYAQTSRQMLQSGDWVVPRYLDTVRTAKPVLIYWCQAAAMKFLGDTAFAARLPSVIAMIATLTILGGVISRKIGARRAVWTVFIFATSGLTIAAAKMCLTDSVLLLFVAIAQLGLFSVYAAFSPLPLRDSRDEGLTVRRDVQPLTPALSQRERGKNTTLLLVLWIAVALAGLTKGPVVLGVMFTTMLVLALFDRTIRWWTKLRPLLGLVIVAIICGPWLGLIHQRAPDFLPTILGHDVIERARSGLEGHKAFPGYYLLTIWATYFPWSLLLPAAIVHAWKRRHLPVIRFCLAAVIGPWVMFEIVQTKLPHYLLPIFPPMAFLTADMLVRAARGVYRDISNPGFAGITLVWGVIVAIVASGPWLSVIWFKSTIRSAWAMLVLSLLGLEYARQVWLYFRAARVTDAAVVMGAGMMVFVIVLYGWYLPAADYLRISPRVANVLKRDGAGRDVLMIDYKEPSLAFYQRGAVREQRANDYLQTTSPFSWPRWLVITDTVWRKVPPDLRDRWIELGRIHGWAYADGGRIVDVLVLRNRARD